MINNEIWGLSYKLIIIFTVHIAHDVSVKKLFRKLKPKDCFRQLLSGHTFHLNSSIT